MSALLPLIRQDSYVIRSAVASRKDLSPEVARKLFEFCGNGETPILLALNPATPQDVLREIAKIGNLNSLAAVAKNPSAPADTLALLAGDDESTVRCDAGQNPSTPAAVLDCLGEDHVSLVRLAVARNKSMTPERWRSMVLNETEADVLHSLTYFIKERVPAPKWAQPGESRT